MTGVVFLSGVLLIIHIVKAASFSAESKVNALTILLDVMCEYLPKGLELATEIASIPEKPETKCANNTTKDYHDKLTYDTIRRRSKVLMVGMIRCPLQSS